MQSTPQQIALVVDDSMLIRHTVCRFLEERGYTVESATNGEEALPIVKRIRPDIIITDMQMPKMTGTELITALKAQPETADIPVVIVAGKNSGFDAEEHREQLRDRSGAPAGRHADAPHHEGHEAREAEIDRQLIPEAAHSRLRLGVRRHADGRVGQGCPALRRGAANAIRAGFDGILDHVDDYLAVDHAGRIAMEYSPLGEVPYVSYVDAGTLERVRTRPRLEGPAPEHRRAGLRDGPDVVLVPGGAGAVHPDGDLAGAPATLKLLDPARGAAAAPPPRR